MKGKHAMSVFFLFLLQAAWRNKEVVFFQGFMGFEWQDV